MQPDFFFHSLFFNCTINFYMFITILLSSDHFQVIPLSFSRNLDRFNPNIPEWRQDVGQVVTKILAKVLVSIMNTHTHIRALIFMQNILNVLIMSHSLSNSSQGFLRTLWLPW